MPAISYGRGAYRRDNGGMPEVRLVNMFLESAPTSETGAILLSREGLTEHSDTGAASGVLGIFREPGVFNGDVFTVSGGKLYRNETEIGGIVGPGPVSFAASDTELAITAGRRLYRYSEADGLDQVTFPDDAYVAHINFHDGLFLAVRADSQKWYYSAVLDADTWEALDFASAERRPDRLLEIHTLNDTAFLFGTRTIEPWANTGDADLPYSRVEQRLFDRGMRSAGCAQKIDNALMFVGDDCIVYRLSEVPQRVSDHGIEERIIRSQSLVTFAYQYAGHSFFAIRIDSGTFQFDLATQQWSELASYGRDNFRGRCAAMIGGEPLFGDDESGKVWALSGWTDDGVEIERRWSAYFPIPGGYATVFNIDIEANVGRVADLTADPIVEMRSSRDGGITWGAWRAKSMGATGHYRQRPRWHRVGLFDAPGAMFEFRVTDEIPVRVSSVRVNEAGGGRSR